MKPILVLLATLGLIGCAGGPQDNPGVPHPLVGSWNISTAPLGILIERDDPRPMFVFREDGTYEMATSDGVLSGTYEIVGDTLIYDGKIDQSARWKREDGKIWLDLGNTDVFLPLVPHEGG